MIAQNLGGKIMKKLLWGVLLLVITCSTSFALTDAEYRVLMKDKTFAQADKALHAAWKAAKSELYGSELEALTRNQ